MKPIFKALISGVAAVCILFGAVGCNNNAKDEENTKLLQQQEELQKTVNTLLEKIESLTGTLTDTKAELESVENKMNDAKTQLETVQAKLNESTDAEEIAKLLEKQAELQTTIDALAEQAEALNSDLTNTKYELYIAQAKLTESDGTFTDYAVEAYEKLVYIDKMLSDRDCIDGENHKLAKKWIMSELLQAGYKEADISYQDVSFAKYVSKTNPLKAAKSFSTDGKFYSRAGWKYQEDENGNYIKATIVSENIIVTKPGKTDEQIIIGMHYDGTGTGDNGSGIALGLTTAQKFLHIETEYTLKFVFFTAEEYGCYGSGAYAESMSETEIANTLYMINMDSLVCGDYCYLYGGVQDNATKTVNQTGAYDNAMAIANKMGLSFKSNPWTWDNLSPDDQKSGVPSYASPSTGDWSDHAAFAEAGVPYLYFEATNWEIPDYTGYGETYLVGMLMNTANDYLDYIESYFPGRPMHHLSMFSKLLNQLLVQNDYVK